MHSGAVSPDTDRGNSTETHIGCECLLHFLPEHITEYLHTGWLSNVEAAEHTATDTTTWADCSCCSSDTHILK